jgi:hypothetical protein
MNSTDLEQIKVIIRNLDQSNTYVPYFEELRQHTTFWPFFADLDSEEIQTIQWVIDEYITEQIQSYKTKWGEMFRRFYALNRDDFRAFRQLNCHEKNIATDEFQLLGKKIEQQLFKFEWILTQTMLKKPQGLDKTVSAYYDIAYRFFPLLSHVQ